MGYYWTLIALLAVGRKASAGCDVLVQETEDMGVSVTRWTQFSFLFPFPFLLHLHLQGPFTTIRST